MSYSVEIRVDSYSSNNSIGIDLIPHTFLVVTGPDGVERGYGFAPEQTGLFGPGNVQNDTLHAYDASSGKFYISENQYNALKEYINRTDAVSPPYALPFGSQCTNWALAGLSEAGIIPSILGPRMEPSNIFFDFIQTLIFNPIWQKIGFELNNLYLLARNLLGRIESQFGPVSVISSCRPGAVIATTGKPSKHRYGQAIDFEAGSRKQEIVQWLIANHHSGGTMTYRDMSHIHVDIGYHFVQLGANSGHRG